MHCNTLHYTLHGITADPAWPAVAATISPSLLKQLTRECRCALPPWSQSVQYQQSDRYLQSINIEKRGKWNCRPDQREINSTLGKTRVTNICQWGVISWLSWCLSGFLTFCFIIPLLTVHVVLAVEGFVVLLVVLFHLICFDKIILVCLSRLFWVVVRLLCLFICSKKVSYIVRFTKQVAGQGFCININQWLHLEGLVYKPAVQLR